MTLSEIYQKLHQRSRCPKGFDPEAALIPWADGDFSQRFFELHTRDDDETAEEVASIVDWLQLKPGQKVLDLGCGGGRTLKALADLGVGGAGIDIGPYPVLVAKEALKNHEDVQIMCADMREGVPEGPFDSILCLYGQWTCFPEAEAIQVLQKAREQLKPGGTLLLELYLGPAMVDAMDEMEGWTVVDRWLGGEYPQMVLDEHLFDLERPAYVRRSYVIALGDEGPPFLEYIQSSELYDVNRLEDVLERSGFTLEMIKGDWDGSQFDDEAVNLIAVARAKD